MDELITLYSIHAVNQHPCPKAITLLQTLTSVYYYWKLGVGYVSSLKITYTCTLALAKALALANAAALALALALCIYEYRDGRS